MILFNLFIASIMASYVEIFSANKAAREKYQLYDILGEWIKYDPKGNGFISFKDFWPFCTICVGKLGMSFDDLMSEDKPGNTILSQLNIRVWQNKNK